MNNCTLCRILAFCLAIYTALCYASKEETIYSEYNTDAILPCLARSYSKYYRSIVWYKDSPNKEGIIRNSSKGHPELYKNYENRTDVSLTEEGSLVLKNVNFSQAGRYMCHLAAEVGHRNNDSYVILNVSASLIKTTPTLDVTTKFTHSIKMNSSIHGLVQPVDVTSFAVLVGFFSLSLSKVLLCFMCVWGMAMFKRHQRRKLWM